MLKMEEFPFFYFSSFCDSFSSDTFNQLRSHRYHHSTEKFTMLTLLINKLKWHVIQKKLRDIVSKTATKKVAHKTGEASGEFMESKINDKTVKLIPVPDANSINLEEIVILLETRKEILN